MRVDPIKAAARGRVSTEIHAGRLPRANTLPCTACGRTWIPGDPGHEYDHYRGYAPEYALVVHALCRPCHVARTVARGEQPGRAVSVPACVICGRVKIPYIHGRCGRCRTYFERHGVERPPDYVRKDTRPRRTICIVCGQDDPRGHFRKGRCNRCDSYLRNLGRERPARLFHA